ncbi:MAG TPA: FGGY-family carbohydrate kinase [Terriglobales bacterium]|nr:FGGY-family carbohydrate kinase [Terriglobales bacterium]
MNEYLIGIDAGTSRVKAVVFDGAGTEVAAFAADNKVYNPGGNRSEQDMRELWQVVCRCIRRVLEEAGLTGADIAGLGVSGQGEGLWLVDKDGEPIGMARLWNDGRAIETALSLRAKPGMERVFNLTLGGQPKSGTTISQVVHAARTEPELLKKAGYIFFCKDYIRYKLTGVPLMEPSDASTSLLDLSAMCPAVDLFEALGVPELARLMPPILPSCGEAGKISPEAAELTGLLEGTPVGGGMLDLISAAAGAGAVNEGDICITMGTTLMHQIVMPEYAPTHPMSMSWEAHCTPGLFSRLAGTMAGTPNLNWALTVLYAVPEFDVGFVTALEEPLSKIPIGSRGVVFHPYTSVSGERAPFINENACGQFSGLKSTTTREQMLRAVYEGIVLSSYDCLADLGDTPGKVFLSGGGAHSGFWVQMLADCLGRELSVSTDRELAAKGAALSAGVACGMFADPLSASRGLSRIKAVYMPDMARHGRYMELYKLYRDVRPNMYGFWDARASYVKND